VKYVALLGLDIRFSRSVLFIRFAVRIVTPCLDHCYAFRTHVSVTAITLG
jgi:hypothetical protein